MPQHSASDEKEKRLTHHLSYINSYEMQTIKKQPQGAKKQKVCVVKQRNVETTNKTMENKYTICKISFQ